LETAAQRYHPVSIVDTESGLMSLLHRIPFAVLASALLFAPAASAADIELTVPDGRRAILKQDGTWRYADSPVASADAAPVQNKQEGEAVISLEGKIEGNRTCRLQLRMVNNLPYEIRSLVPEFAVYRRSGVMYDALLSGFSFIKPGDSQRREVRFNGIDCTDILRVQVGGGDRCEMGDLDKFSPGRGLCIARVRVAASDVLPFEKMPSEVPKPEMKDASAATKADGADSKDRTPGVPRAGSAEGSKRQ
jgi:hypothetical protein